MGDFLYDWISPPGETIADLLEEKGWSQTELARRCAYTKKHISQLVSGKAPLTEETAVKLERVLGGSARFWMTREAQYRSSLMHRKEVEALEAQADWLDELPLKEMIRFGWIRRFSNKGSQVAECLSFFGVSSVDVWRTKQNSLKAAFRASDKVKKNPAAIAAWLRQGERRAEQMTTLPYNRQVFKTILTELRALTNETEPSSFVPHLQARCAEAGVAVVFEPAPKGCPAGGATCWLSPERALIMLSLRHKTNDHLWFAFFHEAAHILLHGKRILFLETEGLDDEYEREADRFARDLLIPPKFAKQLKQLPHTYEAVRRFAKETGVAPAIVVGRMQKEGYLPWSWLNKVKVHYHWDLD